MISKKKKVIYSCLIIISLIAFALANYSKDAFGGAEVPQVIYTVILPEGTSLDVFFNGLFYCLSRVLKFGFVFLFPLFITLKVKDRVIKYKGIYTLLVFIFFLGYSLHSINLFGYVYNEFSYSDFIKDNYVDPRDVEITFPEHKKNLIYILVESLESSYSEATINDKKVNMIPKLSSIKAINFSPNSKLGGFKSLPLTNWTAAGTTAQLSGLPLRVRLNLNDYGKDGEFLPGAIMLGDILEDAGYKNYYALGSDSAFGGHDDLFASHGNYEIYDYKYAKKENKIPKDYYEFWGFEDRKLYEFAKEDLLNISKNPEPFSYIISTIDTHPIDGYLDNKCNDIYDYQYGAVITCEDEMLSSFIEWIKKQDFYEDTVIVIAGDHISMQTDVEEHINEETRYVYNAFINTSFEDINTKRDITPFDMFPTVLAALDVKIKGNRLGLGANLFSEEKTIIEEYGYDYVIKELPKNSKFYYEKFFK